MKSSWITPCRWLSLAANEAWLATAQKHNESKMSVRRSEWNRSASIGMQWWNYNCSAVLLMSLSIPISKHPANGVYPPPWAERRQWIHRIESRTTSQSQLQSASPTIHPDSLSDGFGLRLGKVDLLMAQRHTRVRFTVKNKAQPTFKALPGKWTKRRGNKATQRNHSWINFNQNIFSEFYQSNFKLKHFPFKYSNVNQKFSLFHFHFHFRYYITDLCAKWMLYNYIN